MCTVINFHNYLNYPYEVDLIHQYAFLLATGLWGQRGGEEPECDNGVFEVNCGFHFPFMGSACI